MIGLAWMLARDDYDRSMSQLDFHGSPWDALLTWLPIRYAHKQASMMLWPETEVREDYWTHCCFCNFTIHIYFSSLSLFLFLTLEISFLTFSHLFWQRQARLTKTPFLVSKQVILFSIPVSLETVIICPLKRSHTHPDETLEKPVREIVEADLAKEITCDLLQQTQHQQQHISPFLVPSVSQEITAGCCPEAG